MRLGCLYGKLGIPYSSNRILVLTGSIDDIISCVTLYQASVSGLCDRTCWSVCACRSVHSVLWQNGWVDRDAIWDGEWGQSRDGCIKLGVVIVEGEGAVLGLNLEHPIVTNWDFATRLFPNYFGQYLLIFLHCASWGINIDAFLSNKWTLLIFHSIYDTKAPIVFWIGYT